MVAQKNSVMKGRFSIWSNTYKMDGMEGDERKWGEMKWNERQGERNGKGSVGEKGRGVNGRGWGGMEYRRRRGTRQILITNTGTG